MSAFAPMAPMCQPPNPDHTAPRIVPPVGACDCHAHVFGPAARYDYLARRRYTPPDSPLRDYLSMLDGLGLSRGVLVQPSVYGTDNTCMLDALDGASDRLRGVVALDVLAATDDTLRSMTDRGVRGLRVDAKSAEDIAEGRLRRLADRIGRLGWHIDLLVGRPARIVELLPHLEDVGVPIVVEGMGMITAGQPVSHPGFQALLSLLRARRVWVKLSHVYKITATGMPYADVAPFAHALLQADPGQLIWGTDWPHPNVKAAMPPEATLFDMLCDWEPDVARRHRILVENPASLYGFS
jgi:2-pyrone-4,6-dicarboxylate lactonase